MTGQNMLRFCKETYCDFQIDWIVLAASFIGVAIVVLASYHAGDRGMAADTGTYSTADASDT